jgi:hypothetical protein
MPLLQMTHPPGLTQFAKYSSARENNKMEVNWFWLTWLAVNGPKILKATTDREDSKEPKSTKGKIQII